jgi:uncharacterized membrane protein
MISLGWLGLIYAAPWLMVNHYPLSSLTLYQAFSSICHQAPDRSFHLDGFPLAVCSRCMGIYSGFTIGLAVYPLLRRLDDEEFPARQWLIALAMPMLADFGGGYLGLFSNTFLSRALTGMMFGAVAAFYLLPGFVWIFKANNHLNLSIRRT